MGLKQRLNHSHGVQFVQVCFDCRSFGVKGRYDKCENESRTDAVFVTYRAKHETNSLFVAKRNVISVIFKIERSVSYVLEACECIR